MNTLEIKNLNIGFNMYDRMLNQQLHQAVFNVNLDVKKGEILAVAGSSGSGKSLMAHAVLGILPGNAVTSGEIYCNGELLSEKNLHKHQGKSMVLVPQSVAYLDPLMKVRDQVKGKNTTDEEVWEVMSRLEFTKADLEKYPFQLSGGMARRVLIACALLSDADLIVADEPTPGLSLDLAMEVLKHFKKMAEMGKSILLITHDIDIVCNVADRMALFYGGRIIEVTDTKNFLKGPEYLSHPLTKAFWQALPQNGFRQTDMEEIKLSCEAEDLYMPDDDELI